MGSALVRIDKIGRISFTGKRMANRIAEYSTQNQLLARDLARELETASAAAEAAMWELRKLPLLHGVNVKARAWWVSRHLREARELAVGISAEMVKFNTQFRVEFVDSIKEQKRETGKKHYTGRVQL